LHSYHYKPEGIATRVSAFAAAFDFGTTSDFDSAFTFTRTPAYPAGL
jgi:hypothetical protein